MFHLLINLKIQIIQAFMNNEIQGQIKPQIHCKSTVISKASFIFRSSQHFPAAKSSGFMRVEITPTSIPRNDCPFNFPYVPG
jgi:hypothetical protein